MEITPPPVFPVEIPASERRMPGGWIAFLVLFFLYASMQVISIFAPQVDENGKPVKPAVSVATEELAIKAAVKQEFARLQLREVSPAAIPQTSSLEDLVTVEKELSKKLSDSSEAAALLLVSQTIRGVDLDGMALDKLLLSEEPEYVSLGQAFDGTLESRDEITRTDFVGKIAIWKTSNPEELKIPLAETGVKANAQLLTLFTLYLAFLVAGGAVLVVTYIVLKVQKRIPSVGYQSSLTLGQADRHAARMFFYMFFFIMLSIMGLACISLFKFNAIWTMVGTLLILTLMIPSIVTIAINGPKLPLKAIWGDTSEPFKKVLWGVGGFIFNCPLVAALLAIMSPFAKYLPPPNHEATQMIAEAQGPGMLIGLFLTLAVFAPLIEEPTFRGLLAPALSKVLRSPVWGLILSGAMFAIVHPQGPIMWPALAMIGITCGLLTRQTGSLIPAVVLHFLHNATVVTMVVIIL